VVRVTASVVGGVILLEWMTDRAVQEIPHSDDL